MRTQLLISVVGCRRRVAFLEGGSTVEALVEDVDGSRLVGSVYKGRVVRVLRGMQSAFVEIGLPRAAFLFAGDLADDAQAPIPEGLSKRASEAPIDRRLVEGQELIVQIAKDPIGTKGARVTSHVSLPGRCLVYLPGQPMVGVSRRIANPDERERLRRLGESLRTDEGGLIIRTAAEGLTEEAFAADVAYLQALWRAISARAASTTAPALLHEELDLSRTAIRDLVTSDCDAILVDDPAELQRLQVFLSESLPSLLPLLRLEGTVPSLFSRFGVDTELARARDRKVWMKSGAYLCFDEAEALTAVDVNSGRNVGRTSSFEQTALRINLEAVPEIARQLRLRNIGGIVVIDFIDMTEPGNQVRIQDALVQALSRDRERTHVMPMSRLGLIELTRKREREPLSATLTEACPTCDGRGKTLRPEEVAVRALSRAREVIASRPDIEGLTLEVPAAVSAVLLARFGAVLTELGARVGRPVEVAQGASPHPERFEVRSRSTSSGRSS